MASVTNNAMIDGISGKVGRSLVFRTMRGKTFVSALGRKPNKKNETEAQRNTRSNFKEATQWARRTLQDPEKKLYYQQRAKALKLPNAYTAAITDYMRKPKVSETQHGKTKVFAIHKPGFTLKQVYLATTETTGEALNITTHQHKGCWFIHYTPGASTMSSLTLIIIENSGRKTVSKWDSPATATLKS